MTVDTLTGSYAVDAAADGCDATNDEEAAAMTLDEC